MELVISKLCGAVWVGNMPCCRVMKGIKHSPLPNESPSVRRFLQAIKDIFRSYNATFGPAFKDEADRALGEAHFWYHDHHMLRHPWANEREFATGAWRANQPNPERISDYAKRGIKSILTLRGSANLSHFLFEKEACAAHGIALTSIALSARNAAPKEEYLALLDHFEAIEKPFLIHCKSGADRTGIAAAFYLLHMENARLSDARGQLSWKYLHLRWTKTGILDAILDSYERDLKAHGPIPLRDWLSLYYDRDAVTAAFHKR